MLDILAKSPQPARPPTPRPHRRRAFTLIELLVVVSIIALLISIMLPSLSKAREKAKAVSCGTRLHAFGIATQSYLTEFDNAFPLNGLVLPKSGVPTMYASDPRFSALAVTNQDKWRIEYGALWRYMGGIEVDPSTPVPLPPTQAALAKAYLCPSDITLERSYNSTTTPGNGALTLQVPAGGGNPRVVVGPGTPGYWSYSVNSAVNPLGRFRNNFPNGIGWSDPLKHSNIKRASEFIVFIEEDNTSIFNDEVFDAPAYNFGDKLTDRHSGGGNVLHADWHVEWFNEVQFDEVPPGAAGNATALQSPITRMFFPDPAAVPP